jgi:hypothetical protein
LETEEFPEEARERVPTEVEEDPKKANHEPLTPPVAGDEVGKMRTADRQ